MVLEAHDGLQITNEPNLPVLTAVNESDFDIDCNDPTDFRTDFATIFDLEASGPIALIDFPLNELFMASPARL